MKYQSAAVFCAGLCLTAVFGCTQPTSDIGPAVAVTSVQNVPQILAQVAQLPAESGKPGDHGAPPDYIFSELGYGVVFQTEQNGQTRVVHNGREGKPYKEIKYLTISRDGRRVAYASSSGSQWRMVLDGVEGPFFSDVGTPVFSPDSRHLLYDAEFDKRWHLVVDTKIDTASRSSFYDKLFSKDGREIRSIENSDGDNKLDELVVRDTALKVLRRLKISGGGVVYNQDKTRLAVIKEESGTYKAVVYSLTEPALLSEGRSYDSVDRLAFGPGNEFVYTARKGAKTFLVLNDREQLISGGTPTMFRPVVRPEHASAGIVVNTGKANIASFFFDASVPPQKLYEEVAFIAFDKKGVSYAYCARNGKEMFFVVNGKESPAYDKVLAPEFSPDGTKLVARVRKDGKRFMVVLDLEARVVSQHPAYDVVTGPTFTADGKSVAYGAKDGDKLIWKVEKL